jgi:glycerophosphoryl diester phosphodiesterase
VAHRGGGTLAPENTLAAVKEGARLGFRAIEFDVMLARDGIPVVLHDPYLGRTVPGHTLSSTRSIARSTVSG